MVAALHADVLFLHIHKGFWKVVFQVYFLEASLLLLFQLMRKVSFLTILLLKQISVHLYNRYDGYISLFPICSYSCSCSVLVPLFLVFLLLFVLFTLCFALYSFLFFCLCLACSRFLFFVCALMFSGLLLLFFVDWF